MNWCASNSLHAPRMKADLSCYAFFPNFGFTPAAIFFLGDTFDAFVIFGAVTFFAMLMCVFKG